MVKLFFCVNLAVVNVDGGEEELAFFGEGGGEGEGHGVNFLVSLFEFEDGKAVVGVCGEFVPGAVGEAEAGVEAIEVFDGGDEGGLKGADRVDFELQGSCGFGSPVL